MSVMTILTADTSFVFVGTGQRALEGNKVDGGLWETAVSSSTTCDNFPWPHYSHSNSFLLQSVPKKNCYLIGSVALSEGCPLPLSPMHSPCYRAFRMFTENFFPSLLQDVQKVIRIFSQDVLIPSYLAVT